MLLIDIDGVLNPSEIDECVAGFCEYRLFPENEQPVRLAATHGEIVGQGAALRGHVPSRDRGRASRLWPRTLRST